MINSMAEMSKEMKFVLLANVVVAFIYGFLDLIIPDIYYTLIDAPAFDIHTWRIVGGSFIVLGIFGIIAILRADWDQVKIALEIGIVYEILLFILDIVAFITITSSATWFISQVIATIITIVLVVVNIYFYLRERKRT